MSKLLSKQSGVSLVMALILLVVISIIGLAGSQTTTMQELMSSNLQDRSLAFQTAESALVAGENFVVATVTEANLDCYRSPPSNDISNCPHVGQWFQLSEDGQNTIAGGIEEGAARFRLIYVGHESRKGTDAQQVGAECLQYPGCEEQPTLLVAIFRVQAEVNQRGIGRSAVMLESVVRRTF